MFLTNTMPNSLLSCIMYVVSFLQVRNLLEIGYFVSNIVIMFLLAVGLRQIQLAKTQLATTKEIFRTQSKRAAAEAAVVECRRFADTIIQDRLLLDKYCRENSITYFDVVKFKRTEKGFTIDATAVNKDDVGKLAKLQDVVNRIMNGLEAYALFFLSGVADERIAFHTNAKGYVELVEHVFKLFPVINIEDDDARPTKQLYMMWRERLEAKELKVEKDKLEKKLSTYKLSDIKPIGT